MKKAKLLLCLTLLIVYSQAQAQINFKKTLNINIPTIGEDAICVNQVEGGKYIIAGQLALIDTTAYGLLIKTDSNINVTWVKGYDAKYFEDR